MIDTLRSYSYYRNSSPLRSQCQIPALALGVQCVTLVAMTMPKDILAAFQGLGALRARVDQAFAQVAEQHPQAVVCKPGCDDCCHAMFDLLPVESLRLAMSFSLLDRKLRRDILRRADKAAAAYDQLLERAAGLAGDDRMEALSLARVPCPLLADGRCALYQERPLTCRLYGVPVAIAGHAHTCHLARFAQGGTYPTVEMDKVQAEMQDLSRSLVQHFPELGRVRLDVARALALATSPIMANKAE